MTSKIVAIIVTYNRLALLKEAVAGVKSQTCALHGIVVVDNGSTDGSSEWLMQQGGIIVHRQENLGCPAGIAAGMKIAAGINADWVWVMDDDTICEPGALASLVNKAGLIKADVGFVGSRCVWKDGYPHYMNVPNLGPLFKNKYPFTQYDDLNVLLTETTSWVSLLINMAAIRKVGLPYKEFFIWSDDTEYTQRIADAGFLGCYDMDSRVLHKTPHNYNPDFYHDTPPNLWKHAHGFRNEFFLKKRNKGFAYFMVWPVAKLGYTSFRLLKIRNDHQLKFLKVLWKAGWQSVSFDPQIEMLPAMAANSGLSTNKY